MDSPHPGIAVRDAQKLVTMPVYSIMEGKLLGNIDRLFVDLAGRSVRMIRLGKSLSTWHAFVPFAALRTIGEDIVLVDSESLLREQVGDEELQGLDNDLSGRPVVTQSGERVGKVASYSVALATGRLTQIEMEPVSGFLSRLTSIGKNTVEIPDALVQALGRDTVIVHDNFNGEPG